MAIRYYLIPFETDVEKLNGMACAPKYLDLIGNAQGLIPKETTTDRRNRTWLRNYYIVKTDLEDYTKLDAQPDVIHLTKQKILSRLTKLKNLGIDTAGLTTATRAQIEKRINRWLINDDTRDFSRI